MECQGRPEELERLAGVHCHRLNHQANLVTTVIGQHGAPARQSTGAQFKHRTPPGGPGSVRSPANLPPRSPARFRTARASATADAFLKPDTLTDPGLLAGIPDKPGSAPPGTVLPLKLPSGSALLRPGPPGAGMARPYPSAPPKTRVEMHGCPLPLEVMMPMLRRTSAIKYASLVPKCSLGAGESTFGYTGDGTRTRRKVCGTTEARSYRGPSGRERAAAARGHGRGVSPAKSGTR
jgi:hypothetical protein